MVRSHDYSGVGRQILTSSNVEGYAEAVEHVLAEVCAATWIGALEQVVQVVLTDKSLEIPHGKSRHIAGLASQPFGQHGSYINLYRTSLFHN